MLLSLTDIWNRCSCYKQRGEKIAFHVTNGMQIDIICYYKLFFYFPEFTVINPVSYLLQLPQFD